MRELARRVGKDVVRSGECTNSYLSWEVKFTQGDVVKHINNDVEVIVEGTYFDLKGKPILFVKDSDNKIFGVDPNFYRGIYVEREQDAGN